MARTTGPILAIGAVTLANQSLLNDKPIDWRIPIAAGLAAGLFALFEKGWEEAAVALAWTALAATLFTRLTPGVPSPIESAARWWERGSR